MFFKNKMRVVPTAEYTDYTERFEALDKMRGETKYATRKDVMIMGAVPIAGAAGLFAYNKTSVGPSTINEVVPAVYQPIQAVPDAPIVSEVTPAVEGMIPTGIIADKSLEMLATILDPVIDILIAISFPIASVIMIGACFFFMIGNTEKAWSMIMNAGLGYVLIQLSPLFLDILRTVGEAV